MSQQDYAYAQNDQWNRRGLAVDARASTRGDIMSNDKQGRSVYPRYVSRGAGAHIWDVDGNRYVDYLMGYGPVVLGHADRRVNAAVTEELARGNCFSPLWSARQVELTELLGSVIPGGQSVYLLKTGSDANTTAVRLARIFTGRTKVVRWGYNGWHDWAAGSPAGIPPGSWSETLLLKQYDAAELRGLFESHPGEIACVLIMPFEFDCIEAAQLQELRDVTHEYGAIFVLDEMRSGFRMSLGGAQQYFSVEADLAAYSKAMANGFPISAVVGRRDIMECLSQTRISSTFYASPVEMSAALATITILSETDALDRIWRLGKLFREGLETLTKELSIPAEVVGYAPMPFLRFGPEAAAAKRTFYVETTRKGVLLHPDHQWYISAAHTDADIDFTLEVCRAAFMAARRELEH